MRALLARSAPWPVCASRRCRWLRTPSRDPIVGVAVSKVIVEGGCCWHWNWCWRGPVAPFRICERARCPSSELLRLGLHGEVFGAAFIRAPGSRELWEEESPAGLEPGSACKQKGGRRSRDRCLNEEASWGTPTTNCHAVTAQSNALNESACDFSYARSLRTFTGVNSQWWRCNTLTWFL